MDTDDATDSPRVNPLDYASRTEWYGNGKTPGMRDLADATPEEYDAALSAARTEGNLSRANIAKHLGWTAPESRRQRRNLSAEERGFGAVARLLAAVEDHERDAWIEGARAALQEGRG